MIKSNKYLFAILIVLMVIAGISTVVAVSQNNSLKSAYDGGTGSFNSEDSFSDGGGSFTSDDDSEDYVPDDISDEDVDDEENNETILVGKHVTSNPIFLLLIILISGAFISKWGH